MTTFRRPDSPFECEMPARFSVETYGVTYYGYSVAAIDVQSATDAEIVISYAPTHEQAVEPYVEAYLDALLRGEPTPRLAVAGNSPSTILFPLEQPLLLDQGAQCFHVACEITAPTGRKLHAFHARAFVGDGRLDFKFSASTPVDQMKETWQSVLLSVRLI